MGPYLAIARAACEEQLRLPACGLIVLATLAALALSPALAMFGFQDDAALLKDFGASTILLSGALLAAFGSSWLAARDLDSGAAPTLFSKPVRRSAYLAARLAGSAAALLLMAYLATLVLLLAARYGPPSRAGYPPDGPVLAGGCGGVLAALAIAAAGGREAAGTFTARAFKAGALTLTLGFLLAGSFDRDWRAQPFLAGFDPLLAQAALLAFLGTAALAAAGIFLAVVLRRGAVAGTLLVFAAGIALGGGAPWLVVVPDLEVFWVGEMFYQDAPALPLLYVPGAALYSAAYALACLAAGAWILERRELG